MAPQSKQLVKAAAAVAALASQGVAGAAAASDGGARCRQVLRIAEARTDLERAMLCRASEFAGECESARATLGSAPFTGESVAEVCSEWPDRRMQETLEQAVSGKDPDAPDDLEGKLDQKSLDEVLKAKKEISELDQKEQQSIVDVFLPQLVSLASLGSNTTTTAAPSANATTTSSNTTTTTAPSANASTTSTPLDMIDPVGMVEAPATVAVPVATPVAAAGETPAPLATPAPPTLPQTPKMPAAAETPKPLATPAPLATPVPPMLPPTPKMPAAVETPKPLETPAPLATPVPPMLPPTPKMPAAGETPPATPTASAAGETPAPAASKPKEQVVSDAPSAPAAGENTTKAAVVDLWRMPSSPVGSGSGSSKMSQGFAALLVGSVAAAALGMAVRFGRRRAGRRGMTMIPSSDFMEEGLMNKAAEDLSESLMGDALE